MKITNVKVDVFGWNVARWRVGAGMRFGGPRNLGVVTVETDEGIAGNAFLGGPDYHAKVLIDMVKPRLLGRNPQDIGAIWAGMWRQTRAVATSVIGAVDICLWDINGKLAGQPIHRLLGTCKESVPVYSSTAYWETPEEYQEEALRFKEDGWTAHKIHPHSDPKADIAICRAVREAVGRRHGADARLDVGLRVRGLGAGRPRRRRPRLLLVRGSAGRGGHLQLHQAEREARHPRSLPPSSRPAATTG